jgi:uncharacterized membrane protein YozB (DUF420 family)
MRGFLGTGAPFGADLNLVVRLIMGSALIAGTRLARHKRYKAHGICQTTVLILNLLMIGLVMGPSFQRQVKPALSKVLHKWYYEVAAIHGVLGIVAELLGLYIVIVAGTKRSSTVAALQALEVVDAHGVISLGNCSARWRGDVLRMVIGAIPVVLGNGDL